MNLLLTLQTQKALNTIYSESGYLPSYSKMKIWRLVPLWCQVPFVPKDFLSRPPAIFTAVPAAHKSFCFPALNIPPSRILVRLHLIGIQNQLKNWKKMHKLLITWTGWWNPDRRPHQPAPDKKARVLLCSCSSLRCGWAPCQGASSSSHLAAHLFQELIHITEITRSEQQAAAHPRHFCKVRSVWEVLHRHPLNKWAGLAWCWLLNPILNPFTVQRKSFISCCCSRQTLKERRAGGGKAAQTKRQLTRVWKESKYRVSVHCFCLLTGTVLSLKQLFCDQTLLLHQSLDLVRYFSAFSTSTPTPSCHFGLSCFYYIWGMMPTIEGDVWKS